MRIVPVHQQVAVHRQGKHHVPHSVQLFLRELCRGIRVLLQQGMGCLSKIRRAPNDLADDGAIHVHHIHAALPDGIIPFPDINSIPVKEHGEFVGDVSVRDLCMPQLFFHRVLPVTDGFLAFTRPCRDLLKRPNKYVTVIVPDRNHGINLQITRRYKFEEIPLHKL